MEKVYISGPLQAARNLQSVKELYDYVANICQELGFDPYLPHKYTDPIDASHISDDEVYRQDCDALLTSSFVISYIGEPSHGVGAELALCVANRIPTITINDANQKVSRFLKGMLALSESVVCVEYETRNELRDKLAISFACLSHQRLSISGNKI